MNSAINYEKFKYLLDSWLEILVWDKNLNIFLPPPPPDNLELAALTITSIASFVRSPWYKDTFSFNSLLNSGFGPSMGFKNDGFSVKERINLPTNLYIIYLNIVKV